FPTMFTMNSFVWILSLTFLTIALALDNNLARTPPMGWLSWARFTCETDCELYPDDCISERLYRRQADLLVSQGYADLGYQYVNIDDCWSEKERDPLTHRLVADRKRFPSGIKKLADYVHSKGLKLGIYTDMGTKTCAGYPGLLIENSTRNYFALDSETYAEWEIDSLKVDGCNANSDEFDSLYPRLGVALNLTGRSILYSCSWPAYQVEKNQTPDYAKIAQYCNLWRNFDDIEDSWRSVSSVIDFYANNQKLFAKYQGPGAWFDPDMIVIGNDGLSYEQSKAQMAIWAMLSAPLYMSNDLAKVRTEYKRILQNKHVIAVNQDRFGFMAKRVIRSGSKEVWVKPVEPVLNGHHSFAVVYFYRAELGIPKFFNYTLEEILLPIKTARAQFYNVFDLFENASLIAKLEISERLVLRVNTSGSVAMVKLMPTSAERNVA
ncbi:hypothetical protein B4U79_13701, partial [Dinothrombium tinctorium]